MLRKFFITSLFFCAAIIVHAQVWQWSVAVDSVISEETKDHPQAYLWIPENCKQVKAVVFAQHNMVEEGILEHRLFRKTMGELNMAEVWVTPGINMPFDFTKDAGEDFDYMMKSLADVSGYKELENVPVIPLGHSAYATFPWNFAAWDPERTLALVSVHGDAPQTNLTGYGRANVEWGNRNINGVPSLFITGEYEWWEDRIAPAFNYIAKHPNSVINLFCDAGHGHFDYSDEMVEYVCLFIKKAAKYRLSQSKSVHKTNILNVVRPQQGWLMDRWHKDSLSTAAAAPFSLYKGDRKFASWVFDKEMADATEKFYSAARGKINQHIGFKQNDEILQPQKSHANYQLKFIPIRDGISFIVKAFFADTSKTKPVTAFAKTPLKIDRICGPVKKINDTLFQISFNRLGLNNPKRSNDIWLLAYNKGDEQYKSAVQQLNMRIPLTNKEGAEQKISFPAINDQKAGKKAITLKAVSSAGVPVSYYVKQGPAYVEGNKLFFTTIPPKAKYPLKITVIAWQYGIAGKLQSAQLIEQSFLINK